MGNTSAAAGSVADRQLRRAHEEASRNVILTRAPATIAAEFFTRDPDSAPHLVELARRRPRGGGGEEEEGEEEEGEDDDEDLDQMLDYVAALECLLGYDLQVPPNPLLEPHSPAATLSYATGISAVHMYTSLVAEYAIAAYALAARMARQAMRPGPRLDAQGHVVSPHMPLARAATLLARAVARLGGGAGLSARQVTLRLESAGLSRDWRVFFLHDRALLVAEANLVALAELSAQTPVALLAAYGEWALWEARQGTAPAVVLRGHMLRASFLARTWTYLRARTDDAPREMRALVMRAAHCALLLRHHYEQHMDLFAAEHAALLVEFAEYENSAYRTHEINLKEALVPVYGTAAWRADDVFATHVRPHFDAMAKDMSPTILFELLASQYEGTVVAFERDLDARAAAFRALVPPGWRPEQAQRMDAPADAKSLVPRGAWTVPGALAAYALLTAGTGVEPGRPAAIEALASRLREAGVPPRDLKAIAAAGGTMPSYDALLAQAGYEARMFDAAAPAGAAQLWSRVTSAVATMVQRARTTPTPTPPVSPSTSPPAPRPGYEELRGRAPLTFAEWYASPELGAAAWAQTDRVPRDWTGWVPAAHVGARAGAWLARYSDQEWYDLGVRATDMFSWGVSAYMIFNGLQKRWNMKRALGLFEIKDTMGLMGAGQGRGM